VDRYSGEDSYFAYGLAIRVYTELPFIPVLDSVIVTQKNILSRIEISS